MVLPVLNLQNSPKGLQTIPRFPWNQNLSLRGFQTGALQHPSLRTSAFAPLIGGDGGMHQQDPQDHATVGGVRGCLLLTRSCSRLPGAQGAPWKPPQGSSKCRTVKIMIATHFCYPKPEVGCDCYFYSLHALGSPVEASMGLPTPLGACYSFLGSMIPQIAMWSWWMCSYISPLPHKNLTLGVLLPISLRTPAVLLPLALITASVLYTFYLTRSRIFFPVCHSSLSHPSVTQPREKATILGERPTRFVLSTWFWCLNTNCRCIALHYWEVVLVCRRLYTPQHKRKTR